MTSVCIYFKNKNPLGIFYYPPPLENGVVFHLNNPEYPLPNDALCQVLPSGSEGDLFKYQFKFSLITAIERW